MLPYVRQPQAHPYTRYARIALSLMLALVYLPASADDIANAYDNCSIDTAPTVTANINGAFASTTPHLGFLTEWVNIPHPRAWHCMRYGKKGKQTISALEVGLQTWAAQPVHMANFVHDGETYSIYRATPHVGYIMRQRPVITQSETTPHNLWWSLNTGNQGGKHAFLVKQEHKTAYVVSIESQVRLLKWAPDAGAGNFPKTAFGFAFDAATFKYWTQRIGTKTANDADPPEDVATRAPRYSSISARLTRSDMTCHTPETQTVHLPTVSKSSFTGVGSSAGNTQFDLKLTRCDADIERIHYQLLPITDRDGVHEDGILSLSKDSTASGVKLQVLDENGEPVRFDHGAGTRVQHYDKTGASARIPLQVQYIQSKRDITPGKVHAGMEVVYVYQ